MKQSSFGCVVEQETEKYFHIVIVHVERVMEFQREENNAILQKRE
jgi:hypothetical protein